MENVCIFYGNLMYFFAALYILWPFGICVFVWYIFPASGMLEQREKSSLPGTDIAGLFPLTLASILNSGECRNYLKPKKYCWPLLALVAWHSGHRVRLQN
jgi:hypothetical protein